MSKINLENFPTSVSAQNMLDYVSTGFYENSYVGKWLYQVMGLEYDDALSLAETLPQQFFPETATWGLRYHEEKWQLPVMEHLSYEERRKNIYRQRNYRAPITPYRMEECLSMETDFEVHVADCHDIGEFGYVCTHPNVFRVVFIGEGTLDIKKAKKALDYLKQSHTTYSINERVITVLDNSGLEKILLSNLRLQMRFPFWGCNLFDGSWFFDGSGFFDAAYQGGFLAAHIALNHLEVESVMKTVCLSMVINTGTESVGNVTLITRRNNIYQNEEEL